MAHSPLLRKLISVARLVESTRGEADDYDSALALHKSRRSLLQAGMACAATAATAVMGMASTSAHALAYKPARVAIIGAGLAGLRCAYELKKAGISATVYEANPTRIGGRCHTNRTAFGGNIVENGGELIDTPHTNIRGLAQELGLALDNVGQWAADLGLEELHHVNGHVYTYARAFADFALMFDQLKEDRLRAPFPQTWDKQTQRGMELDRMTVRDYIAAYAPGGLNSDFAKVLDVAYNIEYGAETSQQSAYGLVSLMGYSRKPTSAVATLTWFGESDEKYKIRGGNDQLVSKMAATLAPGQLVLDSALSRIVKNADNTYGLSFTTSANRSVHATADHVVMAIPFSILRANVDFSAAGFDNRKTLAINTMPMGNNCKFQLQFNRRVWHDVKCSGDTFSDLGYQNTWEATRAQATQTAVINNFTGGKTALAYANATNLNTLAKTFLVQWEKLIPGCSAQWNGKVLLNNWPKNPYTKGAYGYYAPGNFSSFVGYEGVRQGNCHFCGEHTSIPAQGYLEGAVETGQICANEILADLKNA